MKSWVGFLNLFWVGQPHNNGSIIKTSQIEASIITFTSEKFYKVPRNITQTEGTLTPRVFPPSHGLFYISRDEAWIRLFIYVKRHVFTVFRTET